jgi:hypothetical protein
MRRHAMTAVLDDSGERMLLMRRHRFIVDRWLWDWPGGYVGDGDPAAWVTIIGVRHALLRLAESQSCPGNVPQVATRSPGSSNGLTPMRGGA